MAALDGALVVLTGAAGGIGSASARALVKRGARVVAVDKDALGLARLRAELGERLHAHAANLRDIAGLEQLADAVHSLHGRIDVLINNAGVTVHSNFKGMSADEVELVLDVNLRAPIHLTRAVLPKLQPGGHIVFVASMAAIQAFPTQSTYSATKSGLLGFSEALRIEAARDRVGVTAVMPGMIATDFLANAHTSDGPTTSRLADLMKRFGTPPEHVARAIVRGIEHNIGTMPVGWDAWAVSAASRVLPSAVPLIVRAAHRYKLLGEM